MYVQSEATPVASAFTVDKSVRTPVAQPAPNDAIAESANRTVGFIEVPPLAFAARWDSAKHAFDVTCEIKPRAEIIIGI